MRENRVDYIADRKIVSISSKRQITIPQRYYTKLKFGKEAECILHGDELIIRPARQNDFWDFSDLILKDLIEEGFEGDGLLVEFKKRQADLHVAFDRMMEDVQMVAEGKGEYYTHEDVFGDLDESDEEDD